MKSFEEELEKAAEEYAETHSVHKRELFGNITYDFQAGARWAEKRLRGEKEPKVTTCLRCGGKGQYEDHNPFGYDIVDCDCGVATQTNFRG